MELSNGNVLYGAYLFLASIVTSTALLHRYQTSHAHRGTYLYSISGSNENSADIRTSNGGKSAIKDIPVYMSKYNSILVELEYPSSFTAVLKNDDVIARAVKDVTQELIVHVSTQHTTLSSDCSDYISSIYSRIWDEMLAKKSLGITCYVISNHRDSHYIKLKDILQLRRFDAVYKSYDELEKSNEENMLYQYHGAKFEDLSAIKNLWDTTIRHCDVFYFDQKGENMPTFAHVAVGGTFDHLHNGHRKLLTLAAGCATKKLTIGISSDELIKHKSYAQLISSYQKRKLVVESFVRFIKPTVGINILSLSDIFGPTVTDPSINALVVSSETIAGAIKINEMRQKSQMKPLTILVTRRSDAATLSSSYIRHEMMK